MKQIVFGFIKGYQTLVSPLLHQLLGVKTACRQTPSCSEYAKIAIVEKGIGRGLLLSTRRFLNCQPYFNL